MASAQKMCGFTSSHSSASQATYIQDQEKTALHSATVPILHEKADKKEDGLFEGEVENFFFDQFFSCCIPCAILVG